MAQTLFTIGIYGTTEAGFFESLVHHGISDFVDVRRRRGLRGHEYSYGNATFLENRLKGLGIRYVHRIELSPTDEVRELQKEADAETHTATRQRTELSPEFAKRYEAEVLRHFDPDAFLKEFPLDAKIVLFCVEGHPRACHRSLLADRISERLGAAWKDITPT